MQDWAAAVRLSLTVACADLVIEGQANLVAMALIAIAIVVLLGAAGEIGPVCGCWGSGQSAA